MGGVCCASVDDKCADNEEVVKEYGSGDNGPPAPEAARTSVKDRKPTGFITKDKLLRVVEQLGGDEDEAADSQKRVVINVENVEFIPPESGSHQEQTLEVPSRKGKRNLTGFVPQLDIAAVDSDEEGEEPPGTQRAGPPRQEITDVQLFQILDDVNGRERGAGSNGRQKSGAKTGGGKKPTISIDLVELRAHREDGPKPAEGPGAAPKRRGKRNLTGFVKKADIEQLDREAEGPRGSAEDAPPSGAAPKPGGPRVSFKGDGAAEGKPASGKPRARKATGISKDALLQIIDDFNDAEDGGSAVEDVTTVNITYTETVTVSAGEADRVAPKLRESHGEEFVSPHGRIVARKGTGFISKQKLHELLQRDDADDGDGGGEDRDDAGGDDDGEASRSKDKVSICVEYTVFVVEDDQTERTRAGPPRESKRRGTGFVTKAEAKNAGPRVSFQEEPTEIAAAEPPAAGRAGGSVMAKLHELIADFEEK